MKKYIFTSAYYLKLEQYLVHTIRKIKKDNSLEPITIFAPSKILLQYIQKKLEKQIPSISGIFYTTLEERAKTLYFSTLREHSQYISPPLQYILLDSIVKEGDFDSFFGEMKGFSYAAQRTISDLKYGCVSPDDLSIYARKIKSEKLEKLAIIYKTYDEKLESYNVYDDPTIFFKAIKNFHTSFERNHIIFYGFWHFHTLEKKFITKIMEKRSVFVFTPYRDVSFFKAAKDILLFFVKQKYNHIHLEEREIKEKRSKNLIIDEHLDIRIYSTLDEYKESMFIAREIYRKFYEGYCSSDIAIISKTIDRKIVYAKDLLQYRNINVSAPYNQLVNFNEAALFLGMLRFLVTFSAENFFSFINLIKWQPKLFQKHGIQGFYPSDWEKLCIDLDIVSGYTSWENILETYIHCEMEKVSSEDSSENDVKWIHKAKNLLYLIRFFYRKIISLRTAHTFKSAADQILELYISICPPSDVSKVITGIIKTIEALDRVQISYSFEICFKVMKQSIENSSYFLQTDTPSILFCELYKYVGISLPVLFLPRMSERDNLGHIIQDPFIPDKERIAMNKSLSFLDISLELTKEKYLQEKMILNLLVNSCKSIIATFSRIDSITGQEKLPIPFLFDLLNTISESEFNFSNLEKSERVHHVSGDFYFHEDPTFAASEIEYDLHIAQRAKKGNKRAQSILSEIYPFYKISQENMKFRWKKNTFSCYDGFIREAKLRNILKEEYSITKQSSVVAKKLELYALCPYRFFLSEILKVNSLKNIKTMETLPLYKQKRILIDVLSDFFHRKNQVEEKETVLLVTSIERIFERQNLKDTMVIEVEQEKLSDSITYFVENELALNNAPYFKVRYGNEGYNGVDITIDTGEKLCFSGYLDQVNLYPHEKMVKGIHYKFKKNLGMLQNNRLYGGEQIRLAIDILALSTIFKDYDNFISTYTSIGENGITREVSFASSNMQKIQEKIETLCSKIIYGIENGFFFAVPGNMKCKFCPYIEICGPLREQILSYKQDDGRIDFYHCMKEIN